MRAILGGVLGKIPRPTPAMAVALLALIIAASGAAVAAIPSTDGTITACRDNRTGALRVINAEGGQTCNAKETQLSWKNGITGKVADSDKLDGQDSAAFLGANQKAADSEKLDGLDSSSFTSYKRTVVVSPVGTDTENGTALLDAISNITDASASKPYLLHIEPATYDLGNGSLSMKPFVDIEGSGELNTVITSGASAANCGSAPGTVTGANNAEMRFLTVRNARNNPTLNCGVAIYNISASPRLTHVTAETGADFQTIAVLNDNSSPIMTDVTATAGAGGKNESIAVGNVDSSPTIRQSKLIGSRGSLVQEGTGTAQVALSQFEGLVDAPPGTLQCFNNYDRDLAAVTCPS
jgi:hypothetical protein